MAGFETMIGRLRSGELEWLAFYEGDTTDQSLSHRVDVNNVEAAMDYLQNAINVSVVANDDTQQMLLAGGINASGTTAAGAAVVTLVSHKDVQAKAHDMTAAKDVNVTANNSDTIRQLAVSAGVSGETAAELGAVITSLESKANAEVASTVTAKNGSFKLNANNTSDITNVAVAVALSAQNAATPVFVYTGYSGETNASLKAGTVKAKYGATVAANSDKALSQYTLGMAASGEVALSGAVSIMKVGDETKAVVSKGTNTTASKMNVTADSDYTLTGASGTFAASGQAGVAVNGMVTIVKANTLAEMGGKATLDGKNGLNVRASSKRDIIKAAVSAGVGGQAGVSLGMMGLIAGDKMDQEAADQLIYGDASNKKKKLFDPSGMISTLKKQGVDTSAMEDQKDKDGNVVRTGLVSDLEGNGTYTETDQLGTSTGSSRSFDVASGYSSDGDTARETGDVQRAKKVGSAAYTDSPKDSVIARVSQSADITGATTVEADQETLADLFGASIGVGGAVGGGISIAIAKLRSNVFAESLGVIHANDGQVTVKAISRSGESKADANEKSRNSVLQKALGKDLVPSNRSIRSIGLAAGGGGAVGAAIAAGFVRLDNITEATLTGHVEKASGIDVTADADYKDVLSATIAAGVGSTVGIAGSLALAVADGTVRATVGKNSGADNAKENEGKFEVNSKGTASAINVKTNSNIGVNAVSVSAAGGIVGGVGGLALATNNLTQDTTVERGVELSDAGKAATLNVTGTSTSKANGYLMGLSVGVGAVGLGVSIVKVKPTLNTTVGVAGAKSGTTTLKGIKDVNVLNDTSSNAKSDLLSAAIGGVTVGVNVMTVYNDTDATAKVANLTGTVDSMKVSGQLDAKGVSNVTAVSAGAAGIGVTVNYVNVNSKNRAEADLTNGDLIINKKLSVTTGDANYKRTTSAQANSTAAAAGLGVVAVNTAIAHNRAQNVSVINGKTVNAKDVELKSFSKGTSTADLTGVDVSLLSVATSVVNARNETTSAKMNLTGSLEGNLDAQSDVQGETKARLLTGGGSLLGSVKTNVATAHGATNALLDVAIGKGSDEWRTISATVNGKDTVTTDIDNMALTKGAVSVATMVGAANSKDVYDNKVVLGGSGTYKLHGIDVITSYEANADSEVTPSSGGVDVSMVGVNVNKSTATSTVYAGANLTVQDARLQTDGVATEIPVSHVGHNTNQKVIDDAKKADVNVLTVGTANVDAAIRPAIFTASVLGVATSKVEAQQQSTQAATLQLGNGGIEKAGSVYVQSVVVNDNTNAVIGTAGTKNKSVKLGAVSVDVNTAKATGKLSSTAAILGGPGDGDLKNNILKAGNLLVRSEDNLASSVTARSDGAYTVGLLTAGSLKAEAFTSDSYNVVFDGVKADITGDAVLRSRASAIAEAIGAMPGSLSVASGSRSDIKAGVGTEANKQISKVLVGEGAELAAGGTLTVHALNNGEVEASFRQGTSFSLAKKASSSQPVDSWLSTAVVIGNGAKLSAGNNSTRTYTTPAIGKLIPARTITETIPGLDILSQTTTSSKSQIEAKNIGLLLNMNKMAGEVAMHSHTDVTIGDGAKLSAKGDVNVFATDVTEALATIDLTGGGLFDGTNARAIADIDRRAVITVGKKTSIESGNGGLFIQSRSGEGDNIQVIAKVKAGGAISIAKARTDATVTSINEINVLEGADLKSKELMRLYAVAGSHGDAKEGSGIYVYPKVISRGVGIAPEAKAVLTMNLNTYININRGGSNKTKLTSTAGRVRLYANNDKLFAFVDPGSDGKSCGGVSTAKTDVIANLKNLIWIDSADISAKTDIEILADNGKGNPARIKVRTLAELYSGGGKVRAENWIKGELNNQIRTNNKSKVTFKASMGKVTHEASITLKDDVDYTRKRAFISTSKKGGNNWEWKKYWRCDFCGKSGGDKNYTGSDIKTIGGRNASSVLESSLAKALAPLTDIQRQAEKISNITRARYGEEDYAAAGKIFVLELPTMLEKDVTLDNDHISKYRLWNNSTTRLDVYLLPNATRMYGIGSLNLHFVAEVLRGDIRGDGETHDIDIITALTEYAVNHPVMPVGSTGSLDFSTGILTLPSKADFELYLHEVSANWLLDMLNEGFIRGMIADTDEADDAAMNGTELPEGSIVDALIPDGEEDGWKKYWLGDTPDTAADPDQTLIYLLVNEETDEVDAFRTSVNSINNNEEPVDVSLYLYRDSRFDRMEEEKYNCMFFDTPEGEKSLVKLVTGVLMERDMETPLPLRIVLRGFYLEGADWPVYSLTDHVFAMCDGTDGQVGMFDGFYRNTFDGDTFDSDYIKIEGIVDGDLNVTVKEGQSIWPEWTGENSAVDIAGNGYARVENEWHPEAQASTGPLPEDAAAA